MKKISLLLLPVVIASSFWTPRALALDLFSTFATDYTILRTTAAGSTSTFATGGFSALAVDTSGNLYASGKLGEFDPWVIHKFTPEGAQSVFANIANAQALAVDGLGNVYSTCIADGTILKTTAAGVTTTFATGGFTALAVDACNNLYASGKLGEFEQFVIHKFTPDGTQSVFANIANAGALAVDRSGNVYSTFSTDGTILKTTQEGATTTFASGSYQALAFGADDKLFAASTSEIYSFAADGSSSVFVPVANVEAIAVAHVPEPSDGFVNISQFYKNSLRDPHSVREDFDRFGGGFGSFEVNPQNGLELLSEAPNSYQGVRILRATLPASRSWQMLVRAHVEVSEDQTQESRNALLQEQPFYAAYLALVKLARGGDGSPSIIGSTPNRAGICLHKSNSPCGWQHYFDFSRFSGGVKKDVADTPLGNQPEVLLRFRYSAAYRSLTAGYSVDGGGVFTEGEPVDLGTEWGLLPDDVFGIYLEATSGPYSVAGGERDFWSNFDQDNSITPAPLPVYSVRSGEIFLANLDISYVPSAVVDFTYETINGSEVTVIGYTGSAIHVSVPQFIDGLPVTNIGPNAFSAKPNLVSVALPSSVIEVAAGSFANSPSLAAVYLPPTIRTIGDGAFANSASLRTLQLPSNLVLQAERFGLSNELAFQELVQRVGASLADNELFMAALVTNEKFLGALTAKILSRYESYGMATQRDLGEFATKQDVQDGLDQSRTQGINSVLANPNSWSLYRADQVSGLSIGDLTLDRQGNGSFVLNYDIEQSNDLETWTTYQNYGEELIGLPQDKKFLRIRVKQ